MTELKHMHGMPDTIFDTEETMVRKHTHTHTHTHTQYAGLCLVYGLI